MKDKKILIVDDSATMRMFLSMTIKKAVAGISLTEAVNGADAVEKLKKDNFDLVLTDINMPEMDGTQLVEKIRGPLNQNMPIIIITTEGEEKHRDLGLSLGANGYITKPVNSYELRNTVSRFLMEGEV
jgi:two-component system chemotaxis response regulator CheY